MVTPAAGRPDAEPAPPPLDPVAIRACLTELVAHEFDREWETVLERAKHSTSLDGVTICW